MPFRTFGSHVCCSVDFMFIYKSAESFVIFPEDECEQPKYFREKLSCAFQMTFAASGCNCEGVGTEPAGDWLSRIYKPRTWKRRFDWSSSDTPKIAKWFWPNVNIHVARLLDQQDQITPVLTYKFKSLVIFSINFLNVSSTLLTLIKWVLGWQKLVSPKNIELYEPERSGIHAVLRWSMRD